MPPSLVKQNAKCCTCVESTGGRRDCLLRAALSYVVDVAFKTAVCSIKVAVLKSGRGKIVLPLENSESRKSCQEPVYRYTVLRVGSLDIETELQITTSPVPPYCDRFKRR